MAPPVLTFPMQRLVFVALLAGIAIYAVVVAVMLQQTGKGLAEPPIEVLDTVAIVAGVAIAGLALLVRRMLQAVAERQTGAPRTMARFRATLVPIAILEGGCLLGLTTWLLNGNPVPGLVVALVLLSLAVLIVPFSDPDER